METLFAALDAIQSLGIHRGGWLFISILLLVPAVVSGNMVQFYMTQLVHRKVSFATILKPLLGNCIVALISAIVLAITIYIYTTS